MEHELTIDRFENDKAVLVAKDGTVVHWPKNNLPADSHEGSILFFKITSSQEKEKDRKALARDILNEILDVS
jgi:hypothetical protein